MVELSTIDFEKKTSLIGFAGDTLNTAIYLKRLLGFDAEIDYLSVIGQDYFSNQLKKYISSEGIGIEMIRHHKSKTIGLYAINTDSQGERTFSYWRDFSAARSLFELKEDLSIFNEYDLIYFSGISLAILPKKIREKLFGVLENRAHKFKVAFDSNYRPNLWDGKALAFQNIQRAFACSDIGFPSLDDQMDLMDCKSEHEVIEQFLEIEIKQTVLKRGALGPRLIGDVNHDCTFKPAVNVVDSTAAGDSFNAGFLAAYFSGSCALNSAWHGHQLAKVVLNHKGAICPKNIVQNLNSSRFES
jgi:2-dehydro-3-deoxygluconokinase